ncbi:MAG: dihydropteroate synthase [bacterium]|nr:dihydropteroate synthase [bacterium]
MSVAPKVVAVVNITEDSFSDGGRYLAPTAAIQHARALTESGADILELGPASSNPDATPVSAALQIERLAPVVDALRSGSLPLSVDATDPEVLAWSLEAGVALLNDIRGFPEPETQARLASAEVDLVVVHSLLERERAVRTEASPEEVLGSIQRFFDARLNELVLAGVAEERLIIDPGMGFFLGSDPAASVAVLQHIPKLRARFGRPVFISVSRKSFLRAITGRGVDEIGAATLTAELHAARAGAEYLRTHDAGALHDGLMILEALDEKR